MTPAISFCVILILACAFAAAEFCHRFTITIKRRWRALSAGVAMAYVFIQVLPELEEHRPVVSLSALGSLLDAERRIYLWALAGLIVFAGLSRLRVVELANGVHLDGGGIVYWGAMTGWATYMLLIGYLILHREDTLLTSLLLFVFAMGLHIFMLDSELRERFPGIYEPWGRIILVASLFLGWALGMLEALSDGTTSRLFAFVVGGVVITSAHEELSVEESGRFWWFAAGASSYATLLLMI